MKTILSILAFSIVTAATAENHVAAGHVVERHSLTLEGARRAGEAATAFAKASGATPSIAVVMSGRA